MTIFGKRGKAFADHHRRGALALVEGKLAYDSWEDKHTGKKRTRLYVIADAWHFVGDRKAARNSDPWGHGPGAGHGSDREPF